MAGLVDRRAIFSFAVIILTAKRPHFRGQRRGIIADLLHVAIIFMAGRNCYTSTDIRAFLVAVWQNWNEEWQRNIRR